MSQENVEIVRQVYEAAARRDSVAVLALYDPQVEWDASRIEIGGLTGTVVHGLDELRAGFASGSLHGTAWRICTTS